MAAYFVAIKYRQPLPQFADCGSGNTITARVGIEVTVEYLDAYGPLL